MDRHLIAVNQDYELDHVCQLFGCTRDRVREAVEKVGNSRRKVYKYIRETYPPASAEPLNIEG